MKVLFIYVDENTSSGYTTGLGIASISSYLGKRGIETELVYYRGAKDLEYARAKTCSFSPEIIGFYGTSSNWKIVKSLSEQIRQWFPALFQIYGGIHAILAPETIEKIKTLDALCLGYGEESLFELADNIANKRKIGEVCGIWLRERRGSDRIIKKLPHFPKNNPDELLDFDHMLFLKELSRFDDFDVNSYRLEVIFNRGCPFFCSFCCNSRLNEIFEERKFLPSPAASIDLLIRSLERTRLKLIEIHDDALTLDRVWFKKFITLYKEKIKAPFICNLRVGTFDEEDIALLKDANVATVWMGIESGNDYIRNQVMRKNITLYEIKEAFEWLHKYKIHSITQNIIGVPYEKPKHFMDTIYLNAQLQPTDYNLSVFFPYPQTELYKVSIDRGWLKKDIVNVVERVTPVLDSPYFSKQQVSFYFKNFGRLIKYQYKKYKHPYIYLLPLNHHTSRLIVKIISFFKGVNALIRKIASKFKYFVKKIIDFLPKITPLFHRRYILNKKIIELNLTCDCNLKCTNCECSCNQAPSKEYLTLEQVRKFVRESIELDYKWEKIKLFGGEPTLYPHFFEAIKILKEYKDFSPDCEFWLLTNGVGQQVKSVLSKIPPWINIINSTEKGFEEKFRWFESYNIAPVDLFRYKLADFSKGCHRIEVCGICLIGGGYYPCAPGAHVDRVFGFDLGLRSLKEVKESSMKQQLRKLCRYCGLYKEPVERVRKEKISRTWEKAYEKYAEKKPQLSMY